MNYLSQLLCLITDACNFVLCGLLDKHVLLFGWFYSDWFVCLFLKNLFAGVVIWSVHVFFLHVFTYVSIL